jgi:hypothetical protein
MSKRVRASDDPDVGMYAPTNEQRPEFTRPDKEISIWNPKPSQTRSGVDLCGWVRVIKLGDGAKLALRHK